MYEEKELIPSSPPPLCLSSVHIRPFVFLAADLPSPPSIFLLSSWNPLSDRFDHKRLSHMAPSNPSPSPPPPSLDPDWFSAPTFPSDGTTHGLSDPGTATSTLATSASSSAILSPNQQQQQRHNNYHNRYISPTSTIAATPIGSTLDDGSNDNDVRAHHDHVSHSSGAGSSLGGGEGSALDRLAHAPMTKEDWAEELEDAEEQSGIMGETDLSRGDLGQRKDMRVHPQPNQARLAVGEREGFEREAGRGFQPQHQQQQQKAQQQQHQKNPTSIHPPQQPSNKEARFAATVQTFGVDHDDAAEYVDDGDDRHQLRNLTAMTPHDSPYSGHQAGFDQSQATFIGEGGPDGSNSFNGGGKGGKDGDGMYGNPRGARSEDIIDQHHQQTDFQGYQSSTGGGESDSGIYSRPEFGRSSSTFSEVSSSKDGYRK